VRPVRFAGRHACRLDTLAARLHPPQTMEGSIVKSLAVVCISILWFRTFRLSALARWRGWRRWLVALSVLPAIVFALAMQAAYEPAVFVMALVAIYVAAEHYSGLREAARDLKEGNRRLRRNVDAVNDSVAVVSAKVREATDLVGTLLNAEGMDNWKFELYGEYKKSTRRVDGVVRYFDIDPLWWRCRSGRWAEYFKSAEDGDGTLFNALLACSATVQFVADLPFPGSRMSWSAAQFRDLLGLAWQLVVFAEVARRRNNPNKYLRVRISGAPSWMHVVDSATYQVVERHSLAQSTVRRLDKNLSTDPDRNRLSDWARRNIRTFAFRGTPGEEYLLGCLRIATLEAGEDDVLKGASLSAVLRELGMFTFIDTPGTDFIIVGKPDEVLASASIPIITRDDALTLCIEVFERFLQDYCFDPLEKAGLKDALEDGTTGNVAERLA
jgi:hypothetical protein